MKTNKELLSFNRFLKVFIIVLCLGIIAILLNKQQLKTQEEINSSYTSYLENNSTFVTFSNGLECVFYNGQRAEAGISCNWEKFNKDSTETVHP